MTESYYARALEGYAGAARAALSEPAAALGEGDSPSEEDLLVRSGELEREAALNLESRDLQVREMAALQLVAGAALDLSVAADLERRDSAELAAGDSLFEETYSDLRDILEAEPALGVASLPDVELGDSKPEDPTDLAKAATEEITAIADHSAAIVGTGIGGLLDIPTTAILAGLGDAADRLLSPVVKAVKGIKRLAMRYVAKAVSKLLRLLPNWLERKAREQLAGWLGEAGLEQLTAFAVDGVLQVERLRRDVLVRIESAASGARDELGAAAGEVRSLGPRFQQHRRVIEAVGKVLGVVRGLILGLGQWAAPALAGVYLAILAYGIWTAGDFLDWYRTRLEGRLDLVVGVRGVVMAAIPEPAG